MIVTRFVMKVIDRIKHPEELRREYEKADRYRKKLEADRMNEELLHEEVLRRKQEYESRRQAAPRYETRHQAAPRPEIAKMDFISTPRDGAKMMAAIGTVQEMRDALRPSNDQADAMALGAIGRFS